MPTNRIWETIFVLFISVSLIEVRLATEADDIDASFHEGRDYNAHNKEASGPTPKDKILLSEVKSLTFQRNKRTTSRRTHSIPQLSCVGGTAGCKLFTTDLVECENISTPGKKTTHANQINWRCHADISDRVKFNHVEVICEGYDYPEDDYILLGSCGLEFTLDYSDPKDHHENSYFHHMEEHEKNLHHQRVRQQSDKKQIQSDPVAHSSSLAISTTNSYIIGIIIMFIAIIIVLVRYYLASERGRKYNPASEKQSNSKQVSRNYGPLTSAVLTTKKAC